MHRLCRDQGATSNFQNIPGRVLKCALPLLTTKVWIKKPKCPHLQQKQTYLQPGSKICPGFYLHLTSVWANQRTASCSVAASHQLSHPLG